jgi:PKD repeat protein
MVKMNLNRRGIQAISISVLLVAVTFSAFQANAAFGQTTTVAQVMIPHTPCNPLPEYGTIWIKTNTSLTPAPAGLAVDLNFTYTNGSGPSQWVAHTVAGGVYQVSSLPVGNTPTCYPVNGDALKIWVVANGNATHQNATTVTYPITANSGYLNDTLSYPQLKPVLTANPTAGEAVLAVTFTGKTTGGTGSYASWNWHFGNGAQATFPNDSFVYNYNTVGTYNARLIVNDSAGDSWETAAVVISVVAAPIVTLSASPTVFNISVATTLTATVTAGTGTPNFSYQYTPGDGTGPFTHGAIASRTDTLVHTYTAVSGATDTLASVSVTDADAKVASSTYTVWVYNVGIHAQYNPADAGVSILFTGSALGGTSAYNYAWFWGDATHTAASGTNTASHTYAAAGTYTVTLQVNDTGNANMIDVTYSITINAPLLLTPTALPNPTDEAVAVTFTGTYSGGTGPAFAYAWRFNDGQTLPSHSDTPVHSFNATGSFNVRFWVNDSGGGSVSNIVVVTVNALPSIGLAVENISTLAATTTAYVGESLDFIGTGATGGTGAYTYDFVYGDATSSGFQAASTLTHAYSSTGTFDATVTVRDAVTGMGTSSIVAITVYNPLSAGTLTADRQAGEVNLEINFTSTSSGGVPAVEYSWVYGDGATLANSGGLQTHTYTTVENVTATVTISDSQGEKIVKHLHISVYGPLVVNIHITRPSANFNPPLNVTYSSTITGGSFNYATVSWTLGDGNISAVGGTETYWHSGAYTITLTVADNASDHSAPTYSFTVYGTGTGKYVSLEAGWNLITLPGVNTNYDMWFLFESLLQSGASGLTTSITIQNTAGAGNLSFPLAANANAAIGPARGIWVDVAVAVSDKVSGNLTTGPLGAATTLQAGWNNLGWALTGTSLSSAFAGEITGATMVSIWNAGTQSYSTFIVNFDTSGGTLDFTLTNGMGVLVWVQGATSFTEH